MLSDIEVDCCFCEF